MATSKVRDSAFVLHSTPYRETSLVVDLLTREHGRVGVVAKGAKRPGSALRAALLQFQPISVVWSGQGELRTLNSAEWLGGLHPPRGDALLCAFYTNELLLRMLPREDAHPALFDAYAATLGRCRTAHRSKTRCGRSSGSCCARPDMRPNWSRMRAASRSSRVGATPGSRVAAFWQPSRAVTPP